MEAVVEVRTCSIEGCEKKHVAKGLCRAHYDRFHYQKNHEKELERQRRYYQKNREKIREKNRRYLEENREKKLEWRRRYLEENREKEAERHRRYYKQNHEKVLEHRRRYYKQNREKVLERRRRYYEQNHEKVLERRRRYLEENRNWRVLSDPLCRRLCYPELDRSLRRYEKARNLYHQTEGGELVAAKAAMEKCLASLNESLSGIQGGSKWLHSRITSAETPSTQHATSSLPALAA